MSSYFYTWNKQNIHPYTLESVSDESFKLKEFPHELYDLSSLSFQASFGFNHQNLLPQQFEMNECLQAIPRFKSELTELVSKELLNLLNVQEGKIFYTVSGAESVENALKIVRKVSGKNVIAAQSKSYHGATLGAISVTGDWRNKESSTIDEWTLRIPDVETDTTGDQTCKFLENYKDKIAAVILEPISAINGVYTGSPFYWKKLRKWCTDNKVFLIFDEVVTGIYRTRDAFAFQTIGIQPDIVCMAKALTNGFFPMGALWANKVICDYFEENILACGLTNYSHPLGIKIIHNVLKLCKDGDFQKQRERNIDIFNDFISSIPLKTRSHGLLGAIELNQAISYEDLYAKGLYIVQRGNTLILAPHLNADEENLSIALKKLTKFLGETGNV
ncbi:MAG: aminotransferase class III-fold pyridoxal phosphate-dependent enzyme [Halobacteriovoraceae bacterium]|nr:aminotransferase class III-fold pyridoxal phosphate-dependent enzyme [Halobacteriovoraceae bacterium]